MILLSVYLLFLQGASSEVQAQCLGMSHSNWTWNQLWTEGF